MQCKLDVKLNDNYLEPLHLIRWTFGNKILICSLMSFLLTTKFHKNPSSMCQDSQLVKIVCSRRTRNLEFKLVACYKLPYTQF